LFSSQVITIHQNSHDAIGGARGIGLMIAQAFVENGSTVLICGRNEQMCKEAAVELTSRGPGTCSHIAANLVLEEECKVGNSSAPK
jgi:short-subunit dehydrogenase involved in D-alanine esterification of teichoic acids